MHVKCVAASQVNTPMLVKSVHILRHHILLFFFGPTHPLSHQKYGTEHHQKLPFSEPTRTQCNPYAKRNI